MIHRLVGTQLVERLVDLFAIFCARLAQLVEHRFYTAEAAGSSPAPRIVKIEPLVYTGNVIYTKVQFL